MRAEDDRVVADVHDRVTNQIFGAGLTLVGIVSGGSVDDDIAQRLVDVIEALDIAVRDLRILALIRAVAVGGDGALETSPDTVPVGARPDGEMRVRLRRVEDGAVFAYAMRGHDFFRVSDHMFWARERDGQLLSARSGMPLARRVGDVFYALETDVPLYYQDTHRTPPPEPSTEGPTIVEEVAE